MSASDPGPSPARDAGLVRLDDERSVVDLVARSVQGLWSVVDDLTRLRPVHRPAYRVTIFGSARVDPDHWVYAAVRDLAAELTRLGCDIVTGGGPGLMRAANEGARLADPTGERQSVGIRVDLPFEQEVNAFVGQAYDTGASSRACTTSRSSRTPSWWSRAASAPCSS